jgi:hypothetical protein
VIDFIELIEAEGRALRLNMVRLCFIVIFFIIAGIMTISGFVLLFGGIFKLVADHFDRVTAYFATGSTCLVISVALFAAGFREMSIKRGERGEGPVDIQGTEEKIPLGGEGGPEAIDGEGEPGAAGGSSPDKISGGGSSRRRGHWPLSLSKERGMRDAGKSGAGDPDPTAGDDGGQD